MKTVVDELRQEGVKAGLLRIRTGVTKNINETITKKIFL
jgi:hypothetical protein